MDNSSVYLKSVAVDHRVVVEVWAAAGTKIDVANLVLAYQPTQAVFGGVVEPPGWLITPNVTPSAVSVSLTANGDPTKAVGQETDGILTTLSFIPLPGSAEFSATLTGIVVNSHDGTPQIISATTAAVMLDIAPSLSPKPDPSAAVASASVATGPSVSIPDVPSPLDDLSVGDKVQTPYGPGEITRLPKEGNLVTVRIEATSEYRLITTNALSASQFQGANPPYNDVASHDNIHSATPSLDKRNSFETATARSHIKIYDSWSRVTLWLLGIATLISSVAFLGIFDVFSNQRHSSTLYQTYNKVRAWGTLENISEYRLHDGAVYQLVDSRTAANLGVSAAKNIPFRGSWLCIGSRTKTADCETVVTERRRADTDDTCLHNLTWLPSAIGPQSVATEICIGDKSLSVEKTWTIFKEIRAFRAEQDMALRGGRGVCDVERVLAPQGFNIRGEPHAVCKVMRGRWEGRQ